MINLNSLLDEWDRPNKDLYLIELEALTTGICIRHDNHEKTRSLLKKIFDVQSIKDHPSDDWDYFKYMNLSIYTDEEVIYSIHNEDKSKTISAGFNPRSKEELVNTLIMAVFSLKEENTLFLKISIIKGQKRLKHESSIFFTNLSQYMTNDFKKLLPKKMPKEAKQIVQRYMKERSLLKLQKFIDYYTEKKYQVESNEEDRTVLNVEEIKAIDERIESEWASDNDGIELKREYLTLLRDSCNVPKEDPDYSHIG